MVVENITDLTMLSEDFTNGASGTMSDKWPVRRGHVYTYRRCCESHYMSGMTPTVSGSTCPETEEEVKIEDGERVN